jgi:hypothetical protein
MRVPRYEGEINVNSLPGERVPTQAPLESFGGGDAMNTAMNAATQLIKKGRDNADRIKIMDANNRATELKNRILHGYKSDDGQQVLGALDQQGENALALPDSVKKQYDEGISKIYENLNSRQQGLFRQLDDEIRLSVNDRVNSHIGNEYKKLQLSTMNSSVEINQNDAISNFSDEKQVGLAISKIKASIDAGGKMAGWDKNMIKEATDKKVSETHLGIVRRLLDNGDDMKADEYYKKNYNSFTGEDKQSIDKVLSGAKEDREVYRVHDDIMAKKVSESRAKEMIKELYDAGKISAQVRKESTQMIEHSFSRTRAAADESQRNINIALANALDQNGGDFNATEVKRLLRGATTDTRNSALNYSQFVRNGGKSSDPLDYDDIESKLLSADPQIRNSVTQAEITDLNRRINDKGERSRETLLKYYSLNKRNDESFLKKVGDHASETELINNKLVDIGVKAKSNTAKELESRYKAEIRAQQQLQEKPLTREQKVKILDQLTLEDSYGFFGKIGGPALKYIDSKYRFKDTADDIPENLKKLIVDKIKKEKQNDNYVPTDDQILRVYNAMERQ